MLPLAALSSVAVPTLIIEFVRMTILPQTVTLGLCQIVSLVKMLIAYTPAEELEGGAGRGEKK